MKKPWDNSGGAYLLRFPSGKIRAKVIMDYVRRGGYAGVVVFTSGHVAVDLRAENKGTLPLTEIGPRGLLQTDKWWTPEQIRAQWPTYFDATSGHLPLPLLVELGKEYRRQVDMRGGLGGQVFVPSGSGETILALSLAYPDVTFCAVYDNTNPETTRDNDGPLNSIIDATFAVQYWHGKLDV